MSDFANHENTDSTPPPTDRVEIKWSPPTPPTREEKLPARLITEARLVDLSLNVDGDGFQVVS